MALNVIIIIYWTAEGQRPAQEGQAHIRKCGREMIKLQMRMFPAGGEHYRLRGANSRDAQQRRRKERKAAVYECATCVRKVNPAGLLRLQSVSSSPFQPGVKAQRGDQSQSRPHFHHPLRERRGLSSITCLHILHPEQLSRSSEWPLADSGTPGSSISVPSAPFATATTSGRALTHLHLSHIFTASQ